VIVELISSVANEEFVSVKFTLQGDGYYTVGWVGVSASTIEQDFDSTFDRVIIYDSMGRVVATSSNEINTTGLPDGIYFKTYSNSGQIIKAIKVLP